jgi:hypothetical protein
MHSTSGAGSTAHRHISWEVTSQIDCQASRLLHAKEGTLDTPRQVLYGSTLENDTSNAKVASFKHVLITRGGTAGRDCAASDVVDTRMYSPHQHTMQLR